VNPYFFEIVRRGGDRYSWILVRDRDGRRRVLARAHRDYRSPRKARRAVEALKEVVGAADIVTAFDHYPLPVATFEVVAGVLPLRMGTFDADEARTRRRRRVAAGGPASAQTTTERPGGGDRPGAVRAQPDQAPATGEPPEPAAAISAAPAREEPAASPRATTRAPRATGRKATEPSRRTRTATAKQS
jgi:hypothetical protein